MEKMTRIEIIRKFFGDVRPVAMVEMKELTSEDRKDLAALAAVEMGVEIKELPPIAK